MIIKMSLETISIASQTGKSDTIINAIIIKSTNNLSATGSSIFPNSVSREYSLAKYPSKKSSTTVKIYKTIKNKSVLGE